MKKKRPSNLGLSISISLVLSWYRLLQKNKMACFLHYRIWRFVSLSVSSSKHIPTDHFRNFCHGRHPPTSCFVVYSNLYDKNKDSMICNSERIVERGKFINRNRNMWETAKRNHWINSFSEPDSFFHYYSTYILQICK